MTFISIISEPKMYYAFFIYRVPFELLWTMAFHKFMSFVALKNHCLLTQPLFYRPFTQTRYSVLPAVAFNMSSEFQLLQVFFPRYALQIFQLSLFLDRSTSIMFICIFIKKSSLFTCFLHYQHPSVKPQLCCISPSLHQWFIYKLIQ